MFAASPTSAQHVCEGRGLCARMAGRSCAKPTTLLAMFEVRHPASVLSVPDAQPNRRCCQDEHSLHRRPAGFLVGHLESGWKFGADGIETRAYDAKERDLTGV